MRCLRLEVSTVILSLSLEMILFQDVSRRETSRDTIFKSKARA
jgi:hypothetical protein